MAKIFFDDFPPASSVIGRTLFQHADNASGAPDTIATSCDRKGTCGECVVTVLSGTDMLAPPVEKESFLAAGPPHPGVTYRLACQARVISDRGDVRVETLRTHMRILERPALPDNGLPDDPLVYRRGNDVHRDGHPIDRYRGGMFGLAVDAGTSTLVVHLIDLETGRVAGVFSCENPQKFGGNSVIHRIAYDGRDPGRLRKILIGHINRAVRNFRVPADRIYETAVSGNPTMRDILFSLDVQGLGRNPFMSVSETDYRSGRRPTTELHARPSGLNLDMHPEGSVYGLPLISRHVGADAASGIMAAGLTSRDSPVFFLDIGTNSEVALGWRNRILAASCAAGPAFEGEGIRHGMPAITGAIEALRSEGSGYVPRVIGGGKARGICGSGLIDAVAEFLRRGLMDGDGRFNGGAVDLPLVDDGSISLNGEDVSLLAQAKAAVQAGQKILLDRFGRHGARLEDVGAFYLAGGFAHAIDVDKAKEIGLLLPLPSEKFVRLGNTSVWGARMALLSYGFRRSCARLTDFVAHEELERHPRFFDLFVDGLKWSPAR